MCIKIHLLVIHCKAKNINAIQFFCADNKYNTATNSEISRDLNRNIDHNQKYRKNKGSISPYQQKENNDRWKTTDGKHRSNSKRRQQPRSEGPKQVNIIELQ